VRDYPITLEKVIDQVPSVAEIRASQRDDARSTCGIGIWPEAGIVSDHPVKRPLIFAGLLIASLLSLGYLKGASPIKQNPAAMLTLEGKR
jgi:hypothetical protein